MKNGAAFFSIFISLLQYQGAYSQQFNTSVDRDKILIGEQLVFTMQLENFNPAVYSFENWPVLPDSFSHFEVIHKTKPDTLLVNGLQSVRQQWAITSFDSGSWTLGPFEVTVINLQSGKKTVKRMEPIVVSVLIPNTSNIKDYNDLKDVADVPLPFNWQFYAVTGLVALTITFLLLKLFKRNKSVGEAATVHPPEKALQVVLQALLQMENRSLSDAADMKKFHADMDHCVKVYLESAGGIKAMRINSHELMQQLQVYTPTLEIAKTMQAFFSVNDAVKYARFIPDVFESKGWLAKITYCLKAIDESIQQANKYVN
jgi:hypothetical protein